MDNGREPIIRLTGIYKTYATGTTQVHALAGVDLSVYRNEYVAIMGPSGSGKSTLMNILGCLDVPSRGQYLLNGADVGGLGPDALAQVRSQEIGFVFQTFNLLPKYSARDNVALPLRYAGWPREARMQRAEAMLEKVGLYARRLHRPNEMSGGQRQRVAIARALANSPALILADEPTGNLDTKTSQAIMELFEQLFLQGNTIILVTHEPDVAAYARRWVKLRDGLIASDTPNSHPTLAKVDLAQEACAG